ncbi:MAG: 2-polyprenyl-3-methyl-6-methoxy-1,4-benzoquinone monooxygenase [Paenalcaligenes sp.]
MTEKLVNPDQALAPHHSAQPTHRPLRRQNTLFDNLITECNAALSVLSRSAQASRPNPAGKKTDADGTLDAQQTRHVAGLMRVNHVGEVCAQALYRGQALLSEQESLRQLLRDAAIEEVDHLVWCDERLKELNHRPSIFNPFWYVASFGLGVIASKAGAPYNLGFMAETERQVEQHLDSHLQQLPAEDNRSRPILEQMLKDEAGHRMSAEANGAVALPAPIRFAMRCMSKVMTGTAYHI